MSFVGIAKTISWNFEQNSSWKSGESHPKEKLIVLYETLLMEFTAIDTNSESQRVTLWKTIKFKTPTYTISFDTILRKF